MIVIMMPIMVLLLLPPLPCADDGTVHAQRTGDRQA